MIPIVNKKIIRRREKLKTYKRLEAEYDFLKNWTIVRKWAVINYELKSLAELETILFLYSEKLFTRTQFENYSNFLSWNKHLSLIHI